MDDLLHHEKKLRAVPFQNTPEGMKPREWRKLVKGSQTFAKHARIDPKDTHLYSVDTAAIHIFCAVMSYARLTDFTDTGGLRGIFMIYFAIITPKYFEPEVLKQIAKSINLEMAKKLSRSEFFQLLAVQNQLSVDVPRFHSGIPPNFEFS